MRSYPTSLFEIFFLLHSPFTFKQTQHFGGLLATNFWVLQYFDFFNNVQNKQSHHIIYYYTNRILLICKLLLASFTFRLYK